MDDVEGTYTFYWMWNTLFRELDKSYSFLGVEFTLLDFVYYTAIVGVFVCFIREIVFFWRDKYDGR